MSISVTDYSIEQLVPHGHPMILIDNPLEADEERLVADFKVREDSLFYNPKMGGIPSWVGMELMAQTIAAYAGYQECLSNNPVRVGFLLGSRKYTCSKTVFPLGQYYKVLVQRLYQEDNGLGSFKCSILDGEKVIAQANINVFSPDNVEAFIAEHKVVED